MGTRRTAHPIWTCRTQIHPRKPRVTSHRSQSSLAMQLSSRLITEQMCPGAKRLPLQHVCPVLGPKPWCRTIACGSDCDHHLGETASALSGCVLAGGPTLPWVLQLPEEVGETK